MAISTDTHIKMIYGCIASMVLGWMGGMAYTNEKYSDLRYDTQSTIASVRYEVGVQLSAINQSLCTMSRDLTEIKKDLKLKEKP